MTEGLKKIHIGILTPHSGDRPHFHALRAIVPEEVTLTIRGLNIAPGAPLEGRTTEIMRGVKELVQGHNIQGLILTGAPISILNPDVEKRLAETVRIPVTIAVRATTAALKSVGAQKLILMTPFDEEMNLQVQRRLEGSGFTVLACPSLEHLGARLGTQVDPEDIFRIVEKAAREAPGADAVYFQGAPFDPLPIIDRVETKLGLPVIASNPAMLWHILSLLGFKFSVKGYGKLLGEWPKII
jgi:maleate cis-trans isomerase